MQWTVAALLVEAVFYIGWMHLFQIMYIFHLSQPALPSTFKN
jgi:hypothetical protein